MSNSNGWMPLYIGDYLSDTMELDAAQHGAYLLLLMYYWRNGPLPVDDAKLAQIARTELRVWKRVVGPIVRAFFREDNGRLHQKRADLEIAKATECHQRAAEKRHTDNERLRAWRAKGAPDPHQKPNGHGPPETPMKRVSDEFQEHFETPDESVAKHVVHSQPQGPVQEEVKVSKYIKSLPSKDIVGSRARVETPRATPTNDDFSAYLNQLRGQTGAEITEEKADQELVKAKVRRAIKAMEMRIPYGEVRSVEAQLAAIQEHPAVVGADVTMSLYWQPAEPIRTPAEQLAAILSISLAEAQARLPTP